MLKPRISSKELLELALEKIDTPINSQDEYNLREEIKQKIESVGGRLVPTGEIKTTIYT